MNDELFEKQIRDGMNAAFDAEDIKVTDELISKTMAAIMAAKGTKAAELNFDEAEEIRTETGAEETAEEKDGTKAADDAGEKDTKVVSFFRRPVFKALASVAAILVVAIVGITVVISNSRMGGMKSADHELMNGAKYSYTTATTAKATMAPAMAETAEACYDSEYYDEYEPCEEPFMDEAVGSSEVNRSMTAENGITDDAPAAAGESDYGFEKSDSDEEDISEAEEAPMVSAVAAEDGTDSDYTGESGMMAFTGGMDGLCGISEEDYALFSDRVQSDIVRVITDPDEIDAESAWDLGASALTIDGYVDDDGIAVYEFISFYENIVRISRSSDGVNEEVTFVEVEDIDALLTEAEELLYGAGSYSTGAVTE